MKRIALAFVTFLVLVGAVTAYDTTETSEIGYPGVGMQTTETISNLEEKIADNRVPVAIPKSLREARAPLTSTRTSRCSAIFRRPSSRG